MNLYILNWLQPTAANIRDSVNCSGAVRVDNPYTSSVTDGTCLRRWGTSVNACAAA